VVQKAIQRSERGAFEDRCPERRPPFTLASAAGFTAEVAPIIVERMPRALALMMLAAAGCTAASARVRDPSPVQPTVTAPVQLRLTLDEGSTWRRTREAFAGDVGGHSLRFELTSALALRPMGAGRVSATETIERLSFARDGERGPLPPGTHGAIGTRTHLVLDDRNEVVEAPRIEGHGGRLLRATLLAAIEALRVQLPEGEVRGGDRWSAPRVTLSPEGLRGITVDVDRTFVLVDVEGDRARVGWEGRIAVRPFAAMGGRIEGRGELHGFSWIGLEDGVTRRTELDVTLAARPAGTSEALELLRVGAKYAERTERVGSAGDEIPEGDRRRLW